MLKEKKNSKHWRNPPKLEKETQGFSKFIWLSCQIRSLAKEIINLWSPKVCLVYPLSSIEHQRVHTTHTDQGVNILWFVYTFTGKKPKHHILGKRSVILHFCSCFWTSESSFLRQLFRPLHLCVPLLLLDTNRKVFTSRFFWYVPSLGVGVENVKDIQSNRY